MDNKRVQEMIKRINRMTFRELREELADCVNTPVKELAIRRLMKHRYLQAKQRKELEKRKVDSLLNSLTTPLENEPVEDTQIIEDTPLEDPIDVDEILNIIDPQHDNASPEDEEANKKRFDAERLNNKLLDRLDSDIRITRMNKNKNKKRVFVSPYSEVDDGKYATFHK